MSERNQEDSALKAALEQVRSGATDKDPLEFLGSIKESGVEIRPFLKRPEDLDPKIAREEGYRWALRSEFEAEANWKKAFAGQKEISQDKLSEKLKDEKLDPRCRGFLEFLSENFQQLAGIAGQRAGDSKTRDSKNGDSKTGDSKTGDSKTGDSKTGARTLRINDVVAAAAMNEIDPPRYEAGLKFLQERFFEISTIKDKVSSERVERLLFDHSYLLFPKETQERLGDLFQIMKTAESMPANFQQGKRVRADFSKDEALRLKANDLVDHARIQALQKGIFGSGRIAIGKNTASPQALKQYGEAVQRYTELVKSGFPDFLAGLEKQ